MTETTDDTTLYGEPAAEPGAGRSYAERATARGFDVQTPRGNCFVTLAKFNVERTDHERANLVRKAERANPKFSDEWATVKAWCFKEGAGKPTRCAGILFNTVNDVERWQTAIETDERLQDAEEELAKHNALDADQRKTGSGMPDSPHLCTERNPYGWKDDLRMLRLDHELPGEWNPFRQTMNGPAGDRETRPTNPAHPARELEHDEIIGSDRIARAEASYRARWDLPEPPSEDPEDWF